LLLSATASATSVPLLTFEQLTDQSEMVVSGQIARTWSDWDSSHRFIWTHYELAVGALYKGLAGSTVVLSEPGGAVGASSQIVADAVRYAVGDRVFVFLQRMPNGYLRTTGWAQGKYIVDAASRVHAASALAMASRPVDGLSTRELAARVTTRVQQTKSIGVRQ